MLYIFLRLPVKLNTMLGMNGTRLTPYFVDFELAERGAALQRLKMREVQRRAFRPGRADICRLWANVPDAWILKERCGQPADLGACAGTD